MMKISGCEKGSVAKELGIGKGWTLVSFDGRPANDILDYLFYDSKENFTVSLTDPDGQTVECEIEKDDDETLGLVFEDDGMAIRTCRNKCVFCFVDQMPPDMRPTLYVKDDDYRQSFLCGNFVTLTNVSDEDIDRILFYRLSPLYVSVHTMNGELRKKIMGNRFADRIERQISRLAGGGIEIHTQVVLVPGMNDGDELDYTARKLHSYAPAVKTLAVVPCGITRYREGLYPISDVSPEYCSEIIDRTDRLNAEFGENFITLADEFFFKAKRQVKPADFYGDYPQLENGVGMTRKLVDELEACLEERENKMTLLVVTGTSAQGLIGQLCQRVEKYCKCLKTHVIGVVNEFFGPTVNCSGLLTGGDVVRAVKAFDKPFDEVVIPGTMLREFEDVFLDGMTVDEMEKATGKRVRITAGTGESFFDALTLPQSRRRY